MMLYHGLSIGRMSVVATLSGLTGSVLPVVIGIAQGDSLSTASAIGIAVAVPAIVLVSWQPSSAEAAAGEAGGASPAARAGATWGFLAGLCFAAFFVGLDKGGTGSGAWPILVNQVVALLITATLLARPLAARTVAVTRQSAILTLCAAVPLSLSILAMGAAFGSGQLAVVVVLVSLYPGITTLLARFFLAERWVASQKVGLLAALAAIVLVSAGSA
jgi:uncharacterized membrane protein